MKNKQRPIVFLLIPFALSLVLASGWLSGRYCRASVAKESKSASFDVDAEVHKDKGLKLPPMPDLGLSVEELLDKINSERKEKYKFKRVRDNSDTFWVDGLDEVFLLANFESVLQVQVENPTGNVYTARLVAYDPITPEGMASFSMAANAISAGLFEWVAKQVRERFAGDPEMSTLRDGAFRATTARDGLSVQLNISQEPTGSKRWMISFTSADAGDTFFERLRKAHEWIDEQLDKATKESK